MVLGKFWDGDGLWFGDQSWNGQCSGNGPGWGRNCIWDEDGTGVGLGWGGMRPGLEWGGDEGLDGDGVGLGRDQYYIWFYLQAGMYEMLNEVYKILIPLHESSHQYNKLSLLHGTLQMAFRNIILNVS